MKKFTCSQVRFVKSGCLPEHWPNLNLGSKEVAIVGRSNVGKSSLLNLLFAQKLALVSATPGKTQLLNFFLVDGQWSFVDLPGYGFASAPKEVQRKWGEAIDTYLTGRKELAFILMLLDLKRDPSVDDQRFLAWAAAAQKPVVIIFTKADQVPQGQWNKRIQQVFASIGQEFPYVVTSTLKKVGRPLLISLLNNLLNDQQEDEQSHGPAE